MPRSNAAASSDRWAGTLAALVVAGLALRLVAIFTIGDRAELHGDEGQYVDAARALARGEPFPGSLRPPGYPVVLAAAALLGGEGLPTLRVAQALLGLLPIVLVFDLVRRTFGRRAATLSGAVVALNPTLVHYAHFFWAETLAATLLAAAVWMADRAGASDSGRAWRWLLGAGVVLGVGALTKEVFVYLGPLFAAWIWWQKRGAPLALRSTGAALVVLGMALAIAPWTARNYAVHGRFVLISTARWVPIAFGLANDPTGGKRAHALVRDLRRALQQEGDEIRREEIARDAALRALAGATPGWMARRLWDGPRKLFSAETQIARFRRAGWIPGPWEPWVPFLVGIEVVFFAASLGLGIAGLWLVPGPRVKPLVVAIVGFFILVHTVGVSTSRYRVPLLPLLALNVGPLLAGFRLRDARARARAVGAAICLLLLGTAIASTWRRTFAAASGTSPRSAGQGDSEPFDS